MSRFAQLVGGEQANVGQSLMYAKQDYAATSLGLLDDYDVKALQEATFYGLPTYTTTSGHAAPGVPVGTNGVSARAALGSAETEAFDPFDAVGAQAHVPHPTDRGTYWTVGE